MTEFENGSKVEIIHGTTPAYCSGPHAPRIHYDEVELMRDDVFREAEAIPAGERLPDGRYAPPQIGDVR